MNKTDAVAFLKAQGLDISVSTLDRHRKDGKVAAGTAKTKTGEAIDYSEAALLDYLASETQGTPSPVTAIAKPSQPINDAQPSHALATVPFQAGQGNIQRAEAVEEGLQTLTKPLADLRQLTVKSVWTIEEAVAVTGVSKGTLKAAVKDKRLRGGLDGGKLKVNATDARRFADELWQG